MPSKRQRLDSDSPSRSPSPDSAVDEDDPRVSELLRKMLEIREKMIGASAQEREEAEADLQNRVALLVYTIPLTTAAIKKLHAGSKTSACKVAYSSIAQFFCSSPTVALDPVLFGDDIVHDARPIFSETKLPEDVWRALQAHLRTVARSGSNGLEREIDILAGNVVATIATALAPGFLSVNREEPLGGTDRISSGRVEIGLQSNSGAIKAAFLEVKNEVGLDGVADILPQALSYASMLQASNASQMACVARSYFVLLSRKFMAVYEVSSDCVVKQVFSKADRPFYPSRDECFLDQDNADDFKSWKPYAAALYTLSMLCVAELLTVAANRSLCRGEIGELSPVSSSDFLVQPVLHRMRRAYEPVHLLYQDGKKKLREEKKKRQEEKKKRKQTEATLEQRDAKIANLEAKIALLRAGQPVPSSSPSHTPPRTPHEASPPSTSSVQHVTDPSQESSPSPASKGRKSGVGLGEARDTIRNVIERAGRGENAEEVFRAFRRGYSLIPRTARPGRLAGDPTHPTAKGKGRSSTE